MGRKMEGTNLEVEWEDPKDLDWRDRPDPDGEDEDALDRDDESIPTPEYVEEVLGLDPDDLF